MKYLFSLAICLILASCATLKKSQDKDITYFEGQVEYDLIYTLPNGKSLPEEITAEMPDKSLLRFKDGNYERVYYHRDSIHSTVILKWEEMKAYTIYPNSDSIFCSDPSNPDINTDITNMYVGDTILGYSTQAISSVMSVTDKTSDWYGAEIKQVYHNSSKLPLNPAHYANFREGKYNKLIEKCPGISLKNETTYYNFMKVTQIATKVEWLEIELDLSIDTTKTIVYE